MPGIGLWNRIVFPTERGTPRFCFVIFTQDWLCIIDFAAKGNFVELDANVAYEILEGILGIPPQKKGFSFTSEGVQMLDKLGDLHKHMVEIQNIINPSNTSMVVLIA